MTKERAKLAAETIGALIRLEKKSGYLSSERGDEIVAELAALLADEPPPAPPEPVYRTAEYLAAGSRCSRGRVERAGGRSDS